MLANSEIIFVTLIAALTAFIARYFLKDTRTPVASLAAENSDPLSFLFDDGVLHHASTSAMQRFSLAPGTHVWDDLRGGMLGQFPDFPERPGVGATGSMKLRPAQSSDRVELEMNWRDGMCWVQLNDVAENSRQSGLSARETGPMERCVRTMVQPAWEVNANGRVGWHNDAYDLLERRLGTLQDGNLFSLDGTKNTQRCSAINAKGPQGVVRGCDPSDRNRQYEPCNANHGLGQRGRGPAHFCANSCKDLCTFAGWARDFRQTRATRHFQSRFGGFVRVTGKLSCNAAYDDGLFRRIA